MDQLPIQIIKRWPEAMSYATVAKYVDLPGADDPAKAMRQGRSFCEAAGIPIFTIGGGKYHRVRKQDVDAHLGIEREG